MSYSGMRHRITNYRTLSSTRAHPFTHLLLYMPPKQNYKIKHGHFKIKAHYFAGAGLFRYITFVLLSLIVIIEK